MFYGCNSLLELELPFLNKKFANLFGVVSYGEISNEIVPLSLKKVTVNNGTIPSNSFSECNNISTIVLGDGITSIGDGAFYHCESLVSVKIPNGVEHVGDEAFYCCYKLLEVINKSYLDIGRKCNPLESSNRMRILKAVVLANR